MALITSMALTARFLMTTFPLLMLRFISESIGVTLLMIINKVCKFHENQVTITDVIVQTRKNLTNEGTDGQTIEITL